jgi:hypothetical protein
MIFTLIEKIYYRESALASDEAHAVLVHNQNQNLTSIPFNFSEASLSFKYTYFGRFFVEEAEVQSKLPSTVGIEPAYYFVWEMALFTILVADYFSQILAIMLL